MLKKFRDWLTSGSTTIPVLENGQQLKLSQRTKLSQSHFVLDDGNVLEPIVGSDKDVEALLAVQRLATMEKRLGTQQPCTTNSSVIQMRCTL